MATNAKGLHSSPGVYTREIDISYSVKSLGVTTLGLVGETQFGPAFQAIPISNFTEFKTYFGGTNPEKYPNGYPRYELPYIAKSYLTESNQLYVTRVLGLSGYEYNGIWAMYNDGAGVIASGSTVENKTVLATIRSKAYYAGETYIPYVSGVTFENITTDITGTSVDFKVNAFYSSEYKTNKGIDPAVTGETYVVSLNPSKKNYILNLLGNTADGSAISALFVEEMFEAAIEDLKKPTSSTDFYDGVKIKLSKKRSSNDNYRSPYSYASTPWFLSELKGQDIIQLFKFYTISDGENANNVFKISIANVDRNTLTFDVVLRSIGDSDSNPIVLESFRNCTLNPNDGNNYLGAKIGTVDELYETRSKYILVEFNDDPQVKNSIPMGVSGYQVKNIRDDINDTVTGLTASKIMYNTRYRDGLKQAKQYFGLSSLTGVDLDFFKFNGIDAEGTTLTHGFHMEVIPTGVRYTENGIIVKLDTLSVNITDKKLLKFTAYFQGGFDGWDIFRTGRTIDEQYSYYRYMQSNSGQVGTSTDYLATNKKQFYNFNGSEFEGNLGIPNVLTPNALTTDYYAFWSAARSFANEQLVDINVFATPGIDTINNPSLVNEIIDMLENERKDSIYIVTTPDKTPGAGDTKAEMTTVDAVVSDLDATGIDSSYAATYYPWCKYWDVDNSQYIFLPPTRDVIRNIALTDNTAYSWFPPAGLGRGNVDCVRAKKNLILEEEDALYDGRINIIKTFAQDGVKIWGQKTLQVADTALNRIGARRMMLYLRKAVRRSGLPLIFEPNDNTTKTRFLQIVSPILNSVKTNRGISDYKIKIDDSAEARARHEMNVQIWVLPIGALEYISVDFIITPEGFDFTAV